MADCIASKIVWQLCGNIEEGKRKQDGIDFKGRVSPAVWKGMWDLGKYAARKKLGKKE